MHCNRWLLASTLVLACGGDDGGDDTGNDTANDDSNDETPASDDFAPQDADASVSADDDAGSSSGAADSTTGAGGCVGAGEACTPNDYCNTWLCTCAAGETEFMTIGSCENGTCTTDGNAACEAICMNSGGVTMAVDGGCG